MYSMKKVFVLILILMFGFMFSVSAEEAGIEISVFIPESLYLHGEGTVAYSSGLSTSFSFGDFIEIPIGFDYCKLHGLMVEGVTSAGAAAAVSKPWFMADSFLPYAKLQLNLPIGPLTISVFGGGAVNWNATLTPLTGFVAQDIASAGEYAGLIDFTYQNSFGFGWLAGASIGLNIEPVTISIFGEYRDVSAPLMLSASYLTGPVSGLTTSGTLDGSNAFLILRGISAGIGGSFAF